MEQPASARRNIRLLTVALPGSNPALDIAGLAALPGFDLIGNAADCDDGLRQAIMRCPDVIILPWSAAAPELIRAIVHLRGERSSPLVAVIADPAELPADFIPPHDGVVIVATDPNSGGLADNLGLLLSSPECEKTRTFAPSVRPDASASSAVEGHSLVKNGVRPAHPERFLNPKRKS